MTTARDERRRTQASMWGNTWEPPSVLRAPKGVDTPGLVTADGHDVVPTVLPPSASDLDEIPEHVIDLADRFLRLPRHLGIHSGGMVMCDRPVIEVCPVEWARMPGRTVLQWDKEDCADAGLVKFDLLGLGMLTALRIGFGFVEEHEGEKLDLHGLPAEDARVYDLLSAADTVGVFQVESRAQMGTLPRLQPRTFYDIVIEVALIRPGPIQGGSVHPYIERAHGRQPVTYLHPLLEKSLAKTKGVPLFQEQLMQMAIDVADFTPAEADQLRRAMGSKRSTERMEAMRGRLMSGMAGHGIDEETGQEIFDKLKAFADFGFPESHAYSFAFLVYASAWLKVYHPAAFYAGLLAAQPMGFYSPQSLAADARRHGLEVLRPDVQASDVQACVERLGPTPAGGEPQLVPTPSGTGPVTAPRGAHGRRRAVARGPARAWRRCGRWGRTSRSGWSTSAARTARSPTCGSWCGGCSCRRRSSRPSPPRGRSTAWASPVARRCGRPARSRRRDRTRCPVSPSGSSAPTLPGPERRRDRDRGRVGDRCLRRLLPDAVRPRRARRRRGPAGRAGVHARDRATGGRRGRRHAPAATRAPRAGSRSCPWRTRPGCSTSSARPGCGRGSARSPARPARSWCAAGWNAPTARPTWSRST